MSINFQINQMKSSNKYLNFLLAITGIFLMLTFSCKKDEKPLTVPVLTTTEVSNISYTTASGGGDITSEGGASVTARGICWSAMQTPTITNDKTSDGTGSGNFTSNLTGLRSNTNYYVRAYATNSVGTSYGSEDSFSTIGYTVTDYDGNIYNAIEIGNQMWMAENLKVTRYRNGDLIGTTVPATLSLLGESSPKYQWAYNGNEDNVAIYGRLYTHYAITESRGICPTGWHAPTDAEWTTLTDYLGGMTVAAGKLKEAGTSHWISPNTGATNETGFKALPGGRRDDIGTFEGIRISGSWWTATEFGSADAFSRALSYNYSRAFSGSNFMKYGISVRCIKD